MLEEASSLLGRLVSVATGTVSSGAGAALSTVNAVISAPNTQLTSQYIDEESYSRIGSVVNKATECVHVSANEPSLGLYRVDEHTRKTLPVLLERKKELHAASLRVEGMLYDISYTRQVAEGLHRLSVFSDIHRQLKYAIKLKGEINQRATAALNNPGVHTIGAMAEYHQESTTVLVASLDGGATASSSLDPQQPPHEPQQTPQLASVPASPVVPSPHGFVRSTRSGRSTGTNTPLQETRSRSNSLSGAPADGAYYINPADGQSEETTSTKDDDQSGPEAAINKGKKKLKKKAIPTSKKDDDLKFKSF